MRPVSILLLFALTSNFTPRTDGEVGATAISSDPAQIVRALRAVRDTDEERAPNIHMTEAFISALQRKHGFNPELLDEINEAYEKLSPSGIEKIFKAQHRARELEFTKANLRDMERTGLQAPDHYMKSQGGGARGKNKETSGGVVYRMNGQGQPEFLLIGSSDSATMKFSLPKGTLESRETIAQSAMREIIEEAGNLVTLEHQLNSKDRGKSTFHPFVAKSKLEYNVYAEDARPRIWLSEKDAKEVLKGEMLQVFEEGLQYINKTPDEKLRKLKLRNLRREDELALERA